MVMTESIAMSQKEIEKATKEGKLSKFIDKAATKKISGHDAEQKQWNEDKKGLTNDTSSSKLKTINVIQDVGLPTFRKRSREGSYGDPLFVTLNIDHCIVRHTPVDTGSSINILFKETLKEMDISWTKVVIAYIASLVGFIGQIMKSDRKICLLVIVGDTAHIVEFLIVSSSSPYNYILGHPALNQLQAKVSTCDLAMVIPNGEEVHVIYRDQKAAQECFFVTVKEVEQKEKSLDEDSKTRKSEPKGDYELFVLDASKPYQIVKIEKNLRVDLQMKMAETLVEYKDSFAWSSAYFGVVPKEIVENKLEIRRCKISFSEKTCFCEIPTYVIQKEIHELFKARSIKPIGILEALSNLVVVAKPRRV